VTYAAAGDPEALAAALAAVLDDPGDPAPRRARAAAFTWERSARAHREVYAAAHDRAGRRR
jgi:glycosyltransferase involved in cell wall biosynthesis